MGEGVEQPRTQGVQGATRLRSTWQSVSLLCSTSLLFLIAILCSLVTLLFASLLSQLFLMPKV